MYQLMIIDDEPVVRAGIKQLIPWEEYNFEICTEATDGKDGLKKLLEYLPDLVLVDIKMPGMNGLELIKEARKHDFEGKFIILTGYSDFEFAKSAVSLGVRAYLLKPIDEKELIDNVEEVLAELEAKKNLDDYYTISELNARQEVLYRLLLHSEDREVLRREIKLYGMDFNYHTFCTVILHPKNELLRQESTFLQDRDRADYILRDLDQVDKIIVDDNLVLINKGRTYQELTEKLLRNNERVKRHFGDGFFMAVGHDVANWEDLHFSYECSKLLLDYEFLYKDRDSVDIEIINCSVMGIEDNFSERLCNMIEVGDIDAISQTMEELKKYYKSKLMKESEIKVQIIHNMVLLYGMLEKRYEEKREAFPDFDLLVENIKKVGNLEDLIQFVIFFSAGAADSIGASTTDNVVKRMIAYMERNYDQDLKLEGIAKIFNYNSAYLGKVFKKVTKESFNDALNIIRIANAKRLLLESDLKVYQVSEQVGYSNTDYFYSKFKKYVGVSPKEFKGKET